MTWKFIQNNDYQAFLLNDQKNITLHSNSNNSNTLSSTTIDEDSIKEEIEIIEDIQMEIVQTLEIIT